MTFLDGAEQVLRQEGQPLHYDEITRRAIAQGLITTQGQTPARTLNAQISASIQRGQSPFERVARGRYGLSDWVHQEQELDAATAAAPAAAPQGQYDSYKDAAQKVLAEAGQPMHYKDVTQRALDAEFINPQGLTPEATMGAQMYADIKSKGAASAFRREGRGIFGLAVWDKGVSGIIRLAKKQRSAVKKHLLDQLLLAHAADFERLIARLLGTMGYENITVTSHSADGGVDVLADIQVGILQLHTAVQVKRHKHNVQRPVVSQLRGDMAALDVDQGMIITTSGFSPGAKGVSRIRNSPLIVLIDGNQLADLLIEHEIGSRIEQIEIVTLEEDRLWAEEESEE